MMIKSIREAYINEVPIHEITQELYELVLMLYEDCESTPGLKRLRKDLNPYKDVVGSVQDLAYVLNEKAKKEQQENNK